MADPGALLATTHEADGLRVRLRLTRPSDALRVSSLVAPEDTRRFTFFDPLERVVLAATAPVAGREEIVGLVDVQLRSDPPVEPTVVLGTRATEEGVGELLADAAARLVARVRRAA